MLAYSNMYVLESVTCHSDAVNGSGVAWRTCYEPRNWVANLDFQLEGGGEKKDVRSQI